MGKLLINISNYQLPDEMAFSRPMVIISHLEKFYRITFDDQNFNEKKAKITLYVSLYRTELL